MNAETMCTYTRDEFRRGLCSLNCSTTAELVTKLGTLRMKLKDAKIFSQVYMYSFNFGKENNQKCISVDAAIALWHILLEGRFLRLADWLSFVKVCFINCRIVSSLLLQTRRKIKPRQ